MEFTKNGAKRNSTPQKNIYPTNFNLPGYIKKRTTAIMAYIFIKVASIMKKAALNSLPFSKKQNERITNEATIAATCIFCIVVIYSARINQHIATLLLPVLNGNNLIAI